MIEHAACGIRWSLLNKQVGSNEVESGSEVKQPLATVHGAYKKTETESKIENQKM